MTATRTQENERKKRHSKSNTIELSSIAYGKVPPQAIELEKAVLGALLIEKFSFDTILDLGVTAACFYSESHRVIFEAMMNLYKAGVPVDNLTLIEQLKKNGTLEEIGGPFTIVQLGNGITSGANLEFHARIVLQKFFQRELIRISAEVLSEAYEDSTDVFELKDKAEMQIGLITSNHVKTSYKDNIELLAEAVQRVDYLRENKDHLTGVPTGFIPLDKLTNGWQPSDLIILAARPSVGKTAFAMNLARNAARSFKKPTPVAFFSLEMSAGQLMQRIISSESEIRLEKILNGSMMDNEHDHFMKTVRKLEDLPVYIDDTPALGILELRSRARRLVAKKQVGLIIIDYLQLMSGKTDGDVKLREQEISNISRGLKSLAKELHIPIIALSQLTRALEKEKREPQLSDLRESGAIEQDADLVAFLTRAAYQKDEKDVDPSINHDADLWIKKHRNGKLAKQPYKTVLSIQKWFDLLQYEEFVKGGSSLVNVVMPNKVLTDAETGEPLEDYPF